MPSADHSFDWVGFKFTLRFTLVLTLFITAAQVGLPYAYAHLFLPTAQNTLVSAGTPVAITPETSVAAAIIASSTQRIINRLTIADAVPREGKFIAADLSAMKLSLYQDGRATAEYPILTKGKPGTPWETPSGFYNVDTKEESHFSSIGKVYMPYSMQFFGNYFIHGWPYYPDGAPVASTFSGGCIRLSTKDAALVFAFADKGTNLFVYDSKTAGPPPSLVLEQRAVPDISAEAYLVADIDTGDVFAEKDARGQRPIASVTKLMTGLVANETINFEQRVPVARGTLKHPEDQGDTVSETFLIGDLLYPLLMESNNAIADSLASYYGVRGFVQWMNTTAKALDMESTRFADPSGASPDNVSTPEDLFRLATYLADKKSFILKITRTPEKTLTADSGTAYQFANFNRFASSTDFVGGKVGHTTPAQDTMLSIFSVLIGGHTRRVAVIVLKSNDYTADTQTLSGWFKQVAQNGASSNTACAACAQKTQYRKIEP